MKLGVRGMAPLLAVADVMESIRFYRDVVGFEIVSVEDDGDDVDFALLRLGGVELMLGTADDDGVEGAAARSGLGLVFACDDVDAAFAMLRERGIAVEEPWVSEFGMKQIYLTDPDGYQSCFQAPVTE